MKKVYGNILKVVVICAIITLVCIELTFILGELLPVSKSGSSIINDAKTTVSSGEELNDMQGWGIIFDSVGGALLAVAATIVLLFCIITALAIFAYILLYFISWRILKKHENKNSVITSLVLTGIACIIQIVIIFNITEFLTSGASIQLAFLVADISEIISVIFTIIMFSFK